MEYVEGVTLRDYLKHQGKLSVNETVDLITGVCQGISFAHRRNMVHRDIKPGNILLAREGEHVVPKIVDFGLARVGYDSSTSRSGYGMGTPYYMPPEQRRDAKSVNHTADIYARGKTIYEMVTGDIPDNVDSEAIPSPAQLSKIIIKCIKSRPEDRYFSVDELVKDLEALSAAGVSAKVPTVAAAVGNICPNSGASHPEDLKFCERCGTGLTRLCPECERENPVHKKFCGACGTDGEDFLQAQEALARIEKLRGEKKWSPITKEFGFLPKELRLPGTKGRALTSTLHKLNGEADLMMKKTKLREQLDQALEAQQLAHALHLVARYEEITSSTDEIDALRSKILLRIDEDYQSTVERADGYAQGGKLTDVIDEYQAYLKKHSGGVHAEDAKMRQNERCSRWVRCNEGRIAAGWI